MDHVLRAAPVAARKMSGAIGATTVMCLGACAATCAVAPSFLAPTCAVVSRGVGTGAMALELCHTLIVNGFLVEHDGDTGVEMQPTRSSSRIWTFIFAGLARVISTGAHSPEFAALYIAVLARTREWVFAYTTQDAAAARAALEAMLPAVGAMCAAAPGEFVRDLMDVLSVWVQFAHCLTRAACEADAADKSAAYVDEWLRSLAARSLREYEMHAVCWVLDGIKPRLDDARFVELLALFAPHGIVADGFPAHAAAACIAISGLAG
jgi:hypothetical protein